MKNLITMWRKASALLTLVGVLFASCNDISEDDSSGAGGSQKARLSFSCNIDSRTIMPVNMAETDVTKIVLKAEKQDSSGKYVEYQLDGEPSKTYQTITDLESANFDIDLGTYNFTLEIYAKTASGIERVTQKAILSDTKIILGDNKLFFVTEYVEYGTIALKFQWNLDNKEGESSSPIGKIEVNIHEINSDGTIGKELSEFTESCEYSVKEISADGASSAKKLCEATYSPSKEILNKSYFILFKLYDNIDKSTVLNTITDIIKIKGFKTEKTIEIDPNNVNKYDGSEPEPGKFYVAESGNDETGNGSLLRPLGSIAGAADKMNNSSIDYEIVINGSLSAAQTLSDTVTTAKAKSVTVRGLADECEDGLAGNFDSSTKGTMLSISTKVPVTIKNIRISGGYNGGGSAGGIVLASGAKLTMESGIISGNTGIESGQAAAGGVMVKATATFIMNDGKICDNTGGGVCLYDGTSPGSEFVMNGGEISGNTASDGAGVHGVYSTANNAKFTMNGGKIIGNTATGDGGGIYLCGQFALTGGEISGNTAENLGNGINVYFGTLSVEGSSIVTDDVYLRENQKITISGAIETSGIAATVLPQTYTKGTQILTLADGVDKSEIAKIALTDEDWALDDNGKLYKPYEIYVSGTGDDTEGDGMEEKPFETVDKACEKIIAAETPGKWTIYIMGDVTGPHEGTNKADKRTYSKDWGRSIIPAEVTFAHAKSILLTGYNELVLDEDKHPNPQDKINRGLGKSSSATGSALIIETPVPVTITNLKITGGNTDNTTASSAEAYSQKGGGIAIAEGATVTLGDGAVIYKNRGYYGGGIYNAGTLYVYGSAIIGNTTQEQMPVKDDANYAEDGGGIYNVGNVYLGYSKYESETSNMPEDWSGCINYNYSWRGGAINNRGTGILVMRDGTIGYNQTVHGGGSGGGGGVYNYGSFIMTGGLIEYNYEGGNSGGGGVCNLSNSTYGSGVFIFTGGAIKSNTAGSGNNGTNGGGGVYNNSVMYVYGDAIIGDDSKTSMANGTNIEAGNCSNLAAGEGGGIYVASNGKLYMGYSAYTSESENTPAEWRGGIFYNYSQSGGGGLGFAYGSSVVIHMNSGTIACNGADKKGAALYIGGDGFIISGTSTIPAGNGAVKQSIYYNSTYSLNIADALTTLGEGSFYLIPSANEAKTSYSDYKPVIKLTDGALNAGLTLSDVKGKFVIEPLTATATGIVTKWDINPSTGKVEQKAATLYVSASGSTDNDGLSASKSLPTLEAAVKKMTDASVDYTIILTGEIKGCQEICNWEGTSANSITVKGKTGSTTDIINANLGDDGEGSALSIGTDVPVTLNGITVKGGNGQIQSPTDVSPCASEDPEDPVSILVGGGLFLAEGAKVSLENGTKIIENHSYYEVSGGNLRTTPGCGAGAYVSQGASLYIDSGSIISDNTGTCYGAGVYVAQGGYLRTQEGSGSYIKSNSFNEEFVDSSTPCGGGVYLEDGSTFEMYGCYIRENSVNGGLGSGIYVGNAGSDTPAVLKMSGYGQINLPNDVYLQGNAPVYIAGKINADLPARLTPESYEKDDEEGNGEDIYLVKLSEEAIAANITLSSYAKHYEITPQQIGDQIQYWFIDTANSCKLSKQTGMAVSVSIPTGVTNDIEVSVTAGGTAVENNTKITAKAALVFMATGYSSYTWKLDGEEQTVTTENILSLDTSAWKAGVYDIYLEAKDAAGKYYSYTAQISLSSN